MAGTGYGGQLEIGGASLSYPFIRSRALNFYSDVDIDEYHTAITLTEAPGPEGSNLHIAKLGSHLDVQDARVLNQLRSQL